MAVKSFCDLQFLMMERPHLLGPAIMVEFSFLAYYLTFESVLSGNENGDKVLKLWQDACRRLHPGEPEYSLYCVKTGDSRIDEEQLLRDPIEAFRFISDKLIAILEEIQQEYGIVNYAQKPVGSDRVLEFIRPHFRHECFFYHKAKAFEAFLLGLISSYEYVLFGSFEPAESGLKWGRELEKSPFSSTRTLADINRNQDEIVKSHFLYSEDATKKSYYQVQAGLSGLVEKTGMLRDSRSRRFLGFPDQP